jgi:hypothetical protein
LKKFEGQGFSILAVNIHPKEDEMVVPFMKGNAYGFLPLKSAAKWAEDVDKVRGTPQNFLIDAEGRVRVKPDVHSPDSQRTLELEIEALLLEAKGARGVR